MDECQMDGGYGDGSWVCCRKIIVNVCVLK